jgi:Holliday junction resolvase RusA-like endonuclease
MKITIPKIPPTINKYIGRSNIWEYQKDKKEYHKLVKLSTIGINPKYEKCKIKVIYFFKDKRRHDPSNYDKFLLDGLVEADIIKDDNYSVIEEYTTIGMYDKEKPRVEIEIETN